MVYIIGENGSGYTPIQRTKTGELFTTNSIGGNNSQRAIWSKEYNAQDLASRANSGDQLTDEEQRYLEARGYSQVAGTRTVYTKKHYAGGLFDSRGNYTGNGRYTYYDSLESGSNVVSSRQEQYVLWERADNPDSLTTGQKIDKIGQSLQAGIISNPAYQKAGQSLQDLKRWGSEGLEESSGEIQYSGLSQLSAKAPEYLNSKIDSGFNSLLDAGNFLNLSAIPLFSLGAVAAPIISQGLQNTVTQGSYIIPGLETFIKQPATLGYSLALVPDALYQTGKYAIDDPVQFAGDLAVGAALGAGLTKGLSRVSEKLPTISRSSTPQEILLKTEIPTAPKIATEGLKYTEAEYKGSIGGNDFFKVSEKVQGDLITVPEKGPTMDVLVGKQTKTGTQEVYVKLTEQQARAIGENYYVDSKNINIGGKSYLELTPIEKMQPVTRAGATDAPQVTTPKYTQIGELADVSSSPTLTNPLRLETKVKATAAELEFKPVEPRLQLPEYTQEVNIKASSPSNFNIYDYYKTPKTESAPIVEFGGNLAEGWIKRDSLQAGETIQRLTGPTESYTKLSFNDWADSLGQPAQKLDLGKISLEHTLTPELLQSPTIQPVKGYTPQLEAIAERAKAPTTTTFKEPVAFRLEDYFKPAEETAGSIEPIRSKDLLQSPTIQPVKEYTPQLEAIAERAKAPTTTTFKEPVAFRLGDYFRPIEDLKTAETIRTPEIRQTATTQPKTKDGAFFIPLPTLGIVPQVIAGQAAFKEPSIIGQQETPRIPSIEAAGAKQTEQSYKNPFAVFTPAPIPSPAPFPIFSPAPVSIPGPVRLPNPATGPALNPSPYPGPLPSPAPFPVGSPRTLPDTLPFPEIPQGKTTIFIQGPPPSVPRIDYNFRMPEQPIYREQDRPKQPVYNLDLRNAIDGLKKNKFYNPFESTAGLEEQLTKRIRRGL